MEKRIYYGDIILPLAVLLWNNDGSGVDSQNQDMGRIILFGTENKKYWIDQIITLHNCITKVTSKTGIFLYQHGFYSCAERRKISWNIL